MRDPQARDLPSPDLAFRLRLGNNSGPGSMMGTCPQPTKQQTPGKGVIVPEGMSLRQWKHGIATLRSLEDTENILLLTPVLVPAGHGKVVESIDSDPFEMLGRTLSLYHGRIRHVPYVPIVGLTETHQILMRDVAAVVVVLCKPDDPEPGQATKSILPEESVAAQTEFAEKVVDELDNTKVDAKSTPLVLIRFGEGQWPDDLPDYENALQGQRYDERVVDQMAALLFKSAT